MKKLLLTTALAAVLVVSANAKFEGGYAGADVGYAWNTSTFKDTSGTTTEKAKMNLNGANLFVNGGYGCNSGSVYLGGEGRFGYNFASKKKDWNGDSFKLNRTWSFGLAGLIGMHATPDLLVALRLGVDYDMYKVKGDLKMTPKVWAFTPGLVGKYMVSSSMYLNASYEYSMPFSTSGLKSPVSYDKKPKTSTVRFGFGSQF